MAVDGSASYRPVRTLANGGMGSVSLVVRQEGSFSRLYAMKRLHAHLQSDEQLNAMFLDEARFAGLIRHANVVSVLDVGSDAEGPYLVMDYIEGTPLSSLMVKLSKQGERFPVQICLNVAAQVADGLQAAHELRDPSGKHLCLVHRDVSPQNILVGYDAVVRVVDFGIAKSLDQSSRTATGALKGKLGYMAPEQLRFEEPTQASDLFALGVVLFELLAGRRLYANSQGMDGARRTLSEAPPDISDDRPEVPAGVVELLFELLAKRPDRRPGSARDVARRLRAEHAELVAEEGLIELEDFLEEHLGEARRASELELQGMLQQLERSSEPEVALPETPRVPERPVAPPEPDLSTRVARRRRAALLGLALGLSVVSLGGAAYAILGRESAAGSDGVSVGSHEVSPASAVLPSAALHEERAPRAVPAPRERAPAEASAEAADTSVSKGSVGATRPRPTDAPRRVTAPRSKPSPPPDPAADFERFH